MNKLDKYITINYIKSFFLGMMMFFLIFLLAESINLTGWIMDKKFTAREALKYLSYGIPEIITNTAPLGVLLGSLLCISKMAKQLEITAMKTSGISFLRIAMYPMIFSFLVSTTVLWINYDKLGKSNTKKNNMKILKVEKIEPIKVEKKFIMVRESRNTILYAGYANKYEGIMKEIEIIKMKEGFKGISKIYTATSGKINPKTNEWKFENLKEHDGGTNSTKPIDTNSFKFKLSMDDVLAEAVAPKNLTMPELREKIVYFTRVGADSTAMRIDFYYRISFALSSFIMCFIGLSLGSRYVRGGAAVNIGLSVIIGYSYYGLSTILKSLASSGTMPIYLACFLPLLIYLIVGIRLFMNAEY